MRERKIVIDQAVIGGRSGASDGFRNERDPQGIQADQPLTDADRGKIEHHRRKSATSRYQDFTSQESMIEPEATDTERTS